MKSIKGIACVVAVALLLSLSVAQVVSAHGGGLNRDGCYNDYKRGTYHCH